MHYALSLAFVLALGGTAIVVLGLGDQLDVVVQTGGGLEGRFVNASPGVVLWLVSAVVFYFSKPRRLSAVASHSDTTSAVAPQSDQLAKLTRAKLDEQRRRIQALQDDVDQAEHYLISVEERITDLRDRAMAEQARTRASVSSQSTGEARVLYQQDVVRRTTDEKPSDE